MSGTSLNYEFQILIKRAVSIETLRRMTLIAIVNMYVYLDAGSVKIYESVLRVCVWVCSRVEGL